MVTLIPKEEGEYHGMGLVDVVWEAMEVIPNCRFNVSITYHKALHGFWE